MIMLALILYLPLWKFFTRNRRFKVPSGSSLRKMVRGKKFGVKTGEGFYNYANGGKVAVDKM